jgi:hypothetical protein
MPNRFAPQEALATVADVLPEVYLHGFTEEEVTLIKLAKTKLDKRNLLEEPVTLTEFKEIVVPYQRILRTTAFNLNPEKVKPVRIPKVPKPKVIKEPKVKKLTKKFIQEELSRLIFSQAMGDVLTDDESIFILTHTKAI